MHTRRVVKIIVVHINIDANIERCCQQHDTDSVANVVENGGMDFVRNAKFANIKSIA